MLIQRSDPLTMLALCILLVINRYHTFQVATADENKSFIIPSAGVSSPSGPLEDAACDVEQIEYANDSQLHLILHELSKTAFFRSFAVDLDHGCPLQNMKKKMKVDVVPKDDRHAATEENTSTSSSLGEGTRNKMNFLPAEEEEEPACASEGLPDFFPEEHDGQPACGVTSEDESPFASSAASFSLAATQTSVQSDMNTNEQKYDKSSKSPETEKNTDTEKKDDNWECDGGSLAEDEMDEDAVPLCEIDEEYLADHTPLTPLKHFLSSALTSITESIGWESEAQKEAFSWSKPSDPVVMTNTEDEGCDDQNGDLPETFWVDMCSQIKAGDGLKVVNLQLNPERNTGYNGTHIWNAIYEENCINVDGYRTEPMCYEERVLFRLLSGLHTSTTISIAKNYFPPSKRKKREFWEPNPQYFMDKFANRPEHIRNLHFSYVVLLRALRKATPFLSSYEIRTGDIVEDETAAVLLRRLLDSHILMSCNNVFTAFDESLMFKDKSENGVSLERNFKGVFHNISSTLDCVQCQQCKLHGKMAMLGYGTALKILFSPQELIPMSLQRNEIVAFINTIAKMSESLKEVRELTHLYWNQKPTLPPSPPSQPDIKIGGGTNDELVDTAIGIVAQLNEAGTITDEREAELVHLALSKDPRILIVAKHFGRNAQKFLLHSTNIGAGQLPATPNVNEEPDAIVIGSGLAGLAATLHLLDRGGRVVVIEKEHRLGGNSAKASSGINGCCMHNDTYGDYLESFISDTTRSAGDGAQMALIETLAKNSEEAVLWLQNRAGVDLSLMAQLGGHSHKRTHRPKNGMAGAEIIYQMQKAVKKYEKTGEVQIKIDTKVTKLITNKEGKVTGVEFQKLNGEEEVGTLMAPHVVLATGGFASDRSSNSYLAHYRPELLRMAATAGDFSTGDGIGLATELGAGMVDMDKVQVHPTGWVNPTDPENQNKVLAAELMRGVGGVLLNSEGKRFCNELGTRAYVTDKMLSHDSYYQSTNTWNAEHDVPVFPLVLSSAAALDGKKHVDLYSHKGLMTKLEGIQALADWMGNDVDAVKATFVQYQEDAEKGVDEWGKTSFRGVPGKDLDAETFYVGKITPVLHYCMGGLTIDTEGNVLDENKNTIEGLHAAGEVSGGVHGHNRLGGNSLLECTVFGTIVGKKIPIRDRNANFSADKELPKKGGSYDAAPTKVQEISIEVLEQHNTNDDCWVAINGEVYDLTEFAEEHPPGPDSILELAGMDGTEAFLTVHNQAMLDDFKDEKKGVLVQ
eukprot:CAMPEP_0195510808 /NCGR_PEP_ID=MMETSP0794_2-20130614/3344_1 /TAXON_ID=515487 /ORGANISM="Stephanopyxis turris, Strain CCMP 815" /LENGTH=1256 /DNA_ID=CAMNT_0040638299 /DNA_START=317 /DNA_END=4087 /DNA_ORIENTATION=+